MLSPTSAIHSPHQLTSQNDVLKFLDACWRNLDLDDLNATAATKLGTPDIIEQRQYDHFKAKGKMAEGDYAAALQLLKSTICSNGPYIGLWCDLVACHYFLGNLYEWRTSLSHTQSVYDLSFARMSPTTQVRAGLMLAKFHELSGEVALAEKMYFQISPIAQASGLQREAWLVGANILRSVAFRNELVTTRAMYATYLSLKDHHLELFHQIEIQHALLHAELALGLFELASDRIADLPSQTPATDRALLVMDYIEESLVRGRTLEPHVMAEAVTLKSTTLFQKWVLSRVLEDFGPAPFHMKDVGRLLPQGEIIRGLMVSLKTPTSDISSHQHRNLVKVFTQSLSEESQHIWSARKSLDHQPTVADGPMSSLEIVKKSWQYHGPFGMKAYDRKPLLDRFLTLLAHERTMTHDRLCHVLWESPTNRSSYDRIRMLVVRVNKDLEEITGEKRLIVFTKSHVKIHESVVFSR